MTQNEKIKLRTESNRRIHRHKRIIEKIEKLPETQSSQIIENRKKKVQKSQDIINIEQQKLTNLNEQ